MGRKDRSRGGRPPLDAVMMFKILALQALYGLFARFDADLNERGYFALGGQIVDASIV